MVGAAPVGEALIEMFHQKAPRVRFREGFGMTEASGAITFGRKTNSVPGSSGQLLPNMRSDQQTNIRLQWLRLGRF